MADFGHSSDDTTENSQEGSSQDSKVDFSEDEETLIERMFNLLGERWSLIAGRIPGRTAEEIDKYWTSRYPSFFNGVKRMNLGELGGPDLCSFQYLCTIILH